MAEKLSNNEFTERIKKLVGDEYVFIDKYDGAEMKLKVLHNVCGSVHMVTPHAFTKGASCPKCSVKKNKLTNDDFLTRVQNQVGDEYTFRDIYKNMRTKLKVVHNVCDTEYMVNPKMFLKGTRCPKCNASKGERYVSDLLRQNDIEYSSQYRFSDCRSKYSLPFDFALLREGTVYAVIEYHGKQHYEVNDYFGGLEAFNSMKERDRIKEDYVNDKNIAYIEIPYILTDKQIDDSIFRALFKYSSAETKIKEGVVCG